MEIGGKGGRKERKEDGKKGNRREGCREAGRKAYTGRGGRTAHAGYGQPLPGMSTLSGIYINI